MSTNLAHALDELEQAFPARPLDVPVAADAVEVAGPDELFDLVPALLAAFLRGTVGRPPKYVARDPGDYLLYLAICARLERTERSAKDFDRVVAALTERQRRAIATALAVIEMELREPTGSATTGNRYGLDRDVAAALDSYWRQFVTEELTARLRRQMLEPGHDVAVALRALDEAFPERPLDDGQTWKELPITFLRLHDDLLLLAIEPGRVVDLLPAFLRAWLLELLDRGPWTSAGPSLLAAALTRHPDDSKRAATFDRVFAGLSDSQRRATAIALSTLERRAEGDDKPELRQAIDSYWGQFSGGGKAP